MLLVEIRNSIAATSQPGLQVGLVNVKARLKHLYADDAHFEFLVQGETKVAVARLEVPALASSISDSGVESSPRDACIGNR